MANDGSSDQSYCFVDRPGAMELRPSLGDGIAALLSCRLSWSDRAIALLQRRSAFQNVVLRIMMTGKVSDGPDQSRAGELVRLSQRWFGVWGQHEELESVRRICHCGAVGVMDNVCDRDCKLNPRQCYGSEVLVKQVCSSCIQGSC